MDSGEGVILDSAQIYARLDLEPVLRTLEHNSAPMLGQNSK